MLDRAQMLGLLADLSDQGEFRTRRDPVALARRVAGINEDLAAFVGAFKELVGEGVQSPIIEFPDFEPLEARGVDPARRHPPEQARGRSFRSRGSAERAWRL